MKINKKIPRTILERKSQYIGVLFLTVLACLLFSLFRITLVNLKSCTAEFRNTSVLEDAYFATQTKIADIASYEKQYNLLLEERRNFDFAYNDKTTLRIMDLDSKVDIPFVLEGGRQIAKDDEMLISVGFANAHKLKIGDSVPVNDKTFTIVGFADFPDYNYAVRTESDLIADANTFGLAAVSKNAMASFTDAGTFYSVKFNSDNRDDFKRALSIETPVLKWVDAKENTRISTTDLKMVSLASIGTAVPVFVLIIVCLLIAIVMARLVKNEYIQIGTLYALGYRKSEIAWHYVKYALIIGLTGSVIGTALGILCVKPFITFYLSYFNIPVLTIHYNIVYCIISVLAPVLCMMAAIYLVVNRGLKLTATELMRGGEAHNRLNILERSIKLDRFRFITKFKIREMVRNVPRALLLMIGVMFASMMLLFGFSIGDAVKSISGTDLDSTYKYKYQYIFNSMQTEKPEKGEAFILAPFKTGSGDNIHNFTIFGVDPNSANIILHDTSVKTGDGRISGNQVIISRILADNLKLKAGDTFKVTSKLTSKDYILKVDAISTDNIGSMIVMPIDKFDEMVGLKAGTYLGLWSAEKLDLPAGSLASVLSMEDTKNAYNAILAPLRYMTGVISIFAFVIGLVIIYIVTSLIIEENRYSISLFKVIGYSKKRIYQMLLNANTWFVIAGFLIGIPAMLGSMSAMMQKTLASLDIFVTMKLSVSTVIISFLILYATYEVSKLMSRKKVNRIPMSEILKASAE